jgi:uncharacterized protein (TIGR03000 family)
MSALRSYRLIASVVMSMLLATITSAQPPPGGHYQGTYVGGSPGSGHSGDSGTYVGGYSGGYHQGYEGVYQGGYPQVNPPPYGVTPYQSYYIGPRPTEADRSRAAITVQVPQGATLWFDGTKTSQSGSLRSFISPPLQAGRNYAYDVRARWTENGKVREETKTVQVHAGDRLQVNLQARK